jgi:hypothetical protein
LNAHDFIYKKYVNEPDAGIVFSLTNCLIKGGLVSGGGIMVRMILVFIGNVGTLKFFSDGR